MPRNITHTANTLPIARSHIASGLTNSLVLFLSSTSIFLYAIKIFLLQVALSFDNSNIAASLPSNDILSRILEDKKYVF